MRYLLDTNALIWYGTGKQAVMDVVDPLLDYEATSVHFSQFSACEISIKYAKGRLVLSGRQPEEFLAKMMNIGMEPADIDLAVFAGTYHLPAHHADPFDRLIIWQAISGGYTLVSSDEKFKLYEPDGLKLLSI
ncbi:MAG: type II toxin-antitoxin system VapC family toxin [Propionibacteriaceae bacterium]|jgi:PIN domain nuclease of toxin-antitoxin system|nr:type II toxin-antitoxin system VapC family toxin [Propionibacteriaceae bacterium]